MRYEIMPGLVIEIDPDKFDVQGAPLRIDIDSADYAAMIDLRVKDIAYDETKTVGNVITLRSK